MEVQISLSISVGGLPCGDDGEQSNINIRVTEDGQVRTTQSGQVRVIVEEVSQQ